MTVANDSSKREIPEQLKNILEKDKVSRCILYISVSQPLRHQIFLFF